MKSKIFRRLMFVLFVWSMPTLSQADFENTPSSEIMAEIEFLKSILPHPPQNILLGHSDQREFLNYLSSFAICEDWDFGEYEEFVAIFERELQSLVPVGETLQIKLLESSYEARAKHGCQVDDSARLKVERFSGKYNSYFMELKNREKILSAIAERSNEMRRRTIGLSN